jgi:Mucin-2 protein WxxW repeating region
MKNYLLRLVTVFLLVFSIQSFAETLSQYVNSCKSELAFTSIPDLHCYDGMLYVSGGRDPRHDYVGYAKINDQVDLAFACRWMFGTRNSPDTGASLEVIIHNRQNGKTCFFAAKDNEDDSIVSPVILSLTGNQASTYWKTPTEVNNGDKCVNCHVAGPYIASQVVASELSTFGLLNNGHDTFVDRNNPAHYKVVGAGDNNSEFNSWHTLVDTFIERSSASNAMCSGSCHSIASYSTVPTVLRQGSILLPSISEVIEGADYYMPPDEDSDYSWINRNANTSTGSAEYFAEAKNDFPGLLAGCGFPTKLEARAVGNPEVFSSSDSLPDVMEFFNLREGLTCLNASQPDGRCNNYEIAYLCPSQNSNFPQWEWFNSDSPNASGDHEGHHRHTTLCSNPLAIKARTIINGVTYETIGPNDRLAELTPTSLVCRDADQKKGGKCSNYVVRYSDCIAAPAPYNIRLTNVWSGKVLTSTGSQNNAETRAQPYNASWNSQIWIVQPIEVGVTAIRLKNLGMTKFLNSETNAVNSKALTYELHADWSGEQWFIEPISGGNQVRIKNVWTGKYLTVADTSDYAAITLQTLNTGWASQKWTLQRL